ncbi:MAG: FtsQ-type POTRA domain-containing protein [Bifidobacteriaceae bacterium]|nr:FtsQ-type POTRA domain-containing protein [Bifidobacteriaceae bacterium]
MARKISGSSQGSSRLRAISSNSGVLPEVPQSAQQNDATARSKREVVSKSAGGDTQHTSLQKKTSDTNKSSKLENLFSAFKSKTKGVFKRADKEKQNTSSRSARSASSSNISRLNENQSKRSARVVSNAHGSRAGEFVDARKLSANQTVEKTLASTRGTVGVTMRPKILQHSDRLKEQKSVSAIYLLQRAAIIIATIACVVGLSWLLFFSPYLRYESANVTISGATEWVNENSVNSLAKKQLHKALLLVSTSEIQDTIANIPGVTSVEVTKSFPKSVVVKVTAKKPTAILKTADSKSMVAVDSEGRILNIVKNASIAGIPAIQVDKINSALKTKSVEQALLVLNSLPEGLRSRITDVQAHTQDSITTVLDGGKITLFWGDSSDLALKKAVIDKIINDPTKIGENNYVDVSAPLRPVMKKI